LNLKLVDSIPIHRTLGRQFRIERVSGGDLPLQFHHLTPQAIRLLLGRDQFGLRVMKRSLGSG